VLAVRIGYRIQPPVLHPHTTMRYSGCRATKSGCLPKGPTRMLCHTHPYCESINNGIVFILFVFFV
jgi:hypothetical protein